MSQSLEAVFGLLVKRSFFRPKQRSFGSYWNYLFSIYSVFNSCALDSTSVSILSISGIWVTAIQLFLKLTIPIFQGLLYPTSQTWYYPFCKWLQMLMSCLFLRKCVNFVCSLHTTWSQNKAACNSSTLMCSSNSSKVNWPPLLIPSDGAPHPCDEAALSTGTEGFYLVIGATLGSMFSIHHVMPHNVFF